MVSLLPSCKTVPQSQFGKLPDGWRETVSAPINTYVREPIVQKRTTLQTTTQTAWDGELAQRQGPFVLQTTVPVLKDQQFIGSALLAGTRINPQLHAFEAVLRQPLQTYQVGEAISPTLSVDLVENRAPFTNRPLRLAHIKSAEDLQAIAETPADNEVLDRRLQDLKLSADTQLSMRSMKPESSEEFAREFGTTPSNGKRRLEWTDTGYKATETSGPFNSRRLSIEYSEMDDTRRWQYYIHTPAGTVRRMEVLEHPDFANANDAHGHHKTDGASGKLSVSA